MQQDFCQQRFWLAITFFVRYKDAMDAIDRFFALAGGPAKVADALHIKRSTAGEMKRRKRIPVRYWGAIIRYANSNGIEGVTVETLMEAHSPNVRKE